MRLVKGNNASEIERRKQDEKIKNMRMSVKRKVKHRRRKSNTLNDRK